MTASSDGPVDTACPATAAMRSGVPAAAGAWPDGRPYGKKDLWVSLPVVPGQDALDRGTDGRRLKFGSFTLDNRNEPTDAKCAPKLTARRLDGPGRATGEADGYASAVERGRTLHFWPTAIDLPGPGCWLMTETLGATTIRFVVDVH